MKKKILAVLLACSSVFAIDLGILTLDTELGGNFSYNKSKLTESGGEIDVNINGDKHFSVGAYGRVWLGFAGFMIAPQVKWDYLKTSFADGGDSSELKLQNLQYGGVLGYRIPFINLTPYIGASYSNFLKGDIGGSKLKDTYAINFGAMWKVPLIPLSIGFDGSWQRAEAKDSAISTKLEMLNLGLSVGLIF